MPPAIHRAATSRADLVRLLAVLSAEEWPAAALALGFLAPRKAGVGARSAAPKIEAIPSPAQSSPPATEPYRPSDLPDLAFWRVVADRTRAPDPAEGEAPAWLAQAAPWDGLPLSDPTQSRPEQAELVPRPRQARLLRRELAQPHRGALDLERLCRFLAERRLPRRLPRRVRPRWPARLDLMLDLALPLRPYWEDFWHLEAGLRHTLGRRLHVWRTRGGDPGDLVVAADGRPGELVLGDGALMILSDAGLYAPGSGRHRRWQDLGYRAARAGVRPLLLAPVPLRSADAGLARGFRLIPWDRGAPLHVLRPCATARADAAPGPHPGNEALVAALAPASRVEPPLLRDLRLALTDQGADVGSEYAVWNHPQVRANLLACALASEHRGEAAKALGLLPDPVQRRLAQLRQAGNRHQSPLIQAEEAIAEGHLAQPEALRRALDLVRRLCATLARGGDPAAGRELAGYVAHLGSRRPDLLAQSPALATAWVITRREDLRRGTLGDIPPGVDLAAVAWLLEDAAPAYLGQVGDALGVFPADWPQPVCHLAELEAVGDYWEVRDASEPPSPLGGRAGDEGAPLPSPLGGRAGDEGAPLPSPLGGRAGDEGLAPPQLLRLGESLTLDPGRRYRLTLGRRQLDLESVRRPPWAAGMGRDAAGLFAQLEDGRRLHWPGWARDQGVDAQGWWAEFEVKGLVQRMRWIPPGQFLMGSPENEPQRTAEGEYAETQHQVTLTQGFWLADTTCTQALWRAVLGESPSRFVGDERPVEQVSWDDLVQRFLPALNALVPGVEAVLPTEAQWEYACRAGTTSPFAFGDNITTDQVNYCGNYPYAGGPKGQYREQTLDVKALPANAWGLHQMHGNVWEWCADWVGPYPGEGVIEPLGPPGGRRRVLRGGTWIGDGGYCRSAIRLGFDPGNRGGGIGFRLARGSSPLAGGPAGSLGGAGVAAGVGAPAAAPASPGRGSPSRSQAPRGNASGDAPRHGRRARGRGPVP